MFSQNNVKRVYRMAHNTGWAERQTTVCWTFCKISFGIKYMLWCYLNWPNYSEHCKIHKELGTNSFLLKSSSSWHTGDWHTSSHFRKPSEETIRLSIDRQRHTKVVVRCLPTEDALYRRPKSALWIQKILTKQQFPRFSQTTYTHHLPKQPGFGPASAVWPILNSVMIYLIAITFGSTTSFLTTYISF